MVFFYKFFTFSQHPNIFYYRKFQNHSQISIHGTNHSQIPTPHTTETPIQPTAANSGNQKPQPPQQQQKSKSQREIGGSKARSRGDKIEGEIERRRDRVEARLKARSSGAVRSARCCDRWDRCDLVRAIIELELEVHRQRQRRDLGSLFFLSLSLSPETIWSENRNGNEFQLSKLLFYSQMKMISGKFYFQNQPNSLFYEKWFPESVYHQNKRTLKHLNSTWIFFHITSHHLQIKT